MFTRIIASFADRTSMQRMHLQQTHQREAKNEEINSFYLYDFMCTKKNQPEINSGKYVLPLRELQYNFKMIKSQNHVQRQTTGLHANVYN